MFKHFVADYLGFTKKERTGIIALLFLILLFALLPLLYPFFIKRKIYDHSAFEKEILALRVKQADTSGRFGKHNFDDNNYQNVYESRGRTYYSKKLKGELFYFDPNTATAADWARLGVREKTTATIGNFLSKGGKFYKPDDIRKIWGFHEDEVKRLLPYVQIQKPAFENQSPGKKYEKHVYEKAKNIPAIIDINVADSGSLVALPGIGSKLSQRILNFRDKLGGFYKVEQISETFGLPDSTFQKIKARFTISNTTIKQININTATLDEMKAHPYLRYVLANAILQYRARHGNYAEVEDIRKIMLITEDTYNKIAPYLKIN